jgi:branched-chain amino acid aminotransferase
MRELCNVDGRIVPQNEATVPVLDRGFLFGDSVYEVMRTYAGVPFAWPEHLARLRASAAGLLLPLTLSDGDILGRMRATLEAAREPADRHEAYVRIIITRGVGTAPNIDLAYAPGPAACLIMVRPAPAMPTAVRLAVIDRLRVDRRALDPALKSGNYLNNVLGLHEAKAQGADDCVMVNHDGFVTEASTSNVFVVAGGVVRTPPLTAGILAGVTRGLVLAVCQREKVRVEEANFTAAALRRADEVFVSSTLRDVLPVTAIDGTPIGAGTLGPLTSRLRTAYARYAAELAATRDAPRWAELTRAQ